MSELGPLPPRQSAQSGGGGAARSGTALGGLGPQERSLGRLSGPCPAPAAELSGGGRGGVFSEAGGCSGGG